MNFLKCNSILVVTFFFIMGAFIYPISVDGSDINMSGAVLAQTYNEYSSDRPTDIPYDYIDLSTTVQFIRGSSGRTWEDDLTIKS